MKVLEYSTQEYDFYSLVRPLFDCELQELDSEEVKLGLTLGKDTHTSLHKNFYQAIDSGWPEFMNLYHSFLSDVVHPLFEDDALIFQKYPGIRFNRPGAKAVYKWHSDGDQDHKHPLGEINIFLPITRCFGNNSMWHESIPGMGDWKPLEIDYGQFLIGYLNQCRHGNKTNDTGKTRVSFDFRVIPGFAYDENYPLKSCTTQQEFKIGGYYEKMTREETGSMYDPDENSKLGSAC